MVVDTAFGTTDLTAGAGAATGASMATGVGVVTRTVATATLFFAAVLDATDLFAGVGEVEFLAVVFLDALMYGWEECG